MDGKCVAPPVAQPKPPPAPVPTAQVKAEPSPAPQAAARKSPLSLHAFGVGLSAGLPDGAVLSGEYRAVDWFHVSLGLAYNGAAPGVELGATLIPFGAVISPELGVVAGHSFQGQYGARLKSLVGASGTVVDDLNSLSYDFATAKLGLVLQGSQFMFSFDVGYTYASGTLNNFQALVSSQSNTSSLEIADPKFKFTVPTLRLGFAFFLG